MTIQLEVGKTYKDREGNKVTIRQVKSAQGPNYHSYTASNSPEPYSGNWWWGNGRSNGAEERPTDLIEEVPSAPTWFTVWAPNGTNPPRVKHNTFELADAEARRLAIARPDQEFYVMQPVALAKGVATTTVAVTSESYR